MVETIYLKDEWGKLQERKDGGEFASFRYEGKWGLYSYNFIIREAGRIAGNKYYDIVTPRGYGGPIVETLNKRNGLREFRDAFQQFCIQNNIIAEYVKFDPWNINAIDYKDYYDLSVHGSVFSPDLRDNVWMVQCSQRRRNQIRKAIDEGIKIWWGDSVERINIFVDLYQYTVKKHSVSKYYLLNYNDILEYFDSLKGRIKLGIAYLDDFPVSAGIFSNGGEVFHYHFGASHPDYLHLNASSLLLFEAEKLAQSEKCRWMDFGSARETSGLEQFKKSMTNEKDIRTLYVGTAIHNKEIYDELVNLSGNATGGFFPAYRNS